MPWTQGCSSINSPHLPKENEEVNAHVKRLQAMLDAATMVDPALDRDDEVLVLVKHQFHVPTC
jgi:hypothetical protein